MTPRVLPSPPAPIVSGPAAPAQIVATRDAAGAWHCRSCALAVGLAPHAGAWRLASDPPLSRPCRTCGTSL